MKRQSTHSVTNTKKTVFAFVVFLAILLLSFSNSMIAQTIPLDFETGTYTFSDFAGGAASVIDNPQVSGINTSTKVGQMIKYAGEVYGGSTLTLSSQVDFGTNNAIKMKVFANRVNIPVTFKLEGTGAPAEVTVPTTVANAWEELTFSFAGLTSGVYNKITFIYDLGVVGDGSADFTLLFDDIDYTTIAASGIQLPIDFESTTLTYAFSDFGGGAATVIDNPQSSGINTTAKVGQMIKYTGEVYGGSTMALGSPIDFGTNNAIKMKVFANRVDAPVLLKLEGTGAPVEVSQNTTVANAWEELTFDYSGFTSGVYNKITFIYDLGVVGDGSVDFTLLFDDLELTEVSQPTGTQMDLPVTFDDPTVNYGLVGFGGAENSAIVQDPTLPSNNVAKVVKSAGAQTWAGTTVTAVVGIVQTGFSSKIPFTASETKMNVRVWSPDAGIPVRLKVEDYTDPTKSVETEAMTTVASDWETLTFDFTVPTNPPTAALNLSYNYNKASIFFNFGTDGATAGEKTYYFDDVKFGAVTSVKETQSALPTAYSLGQNYPNPFNPSTLISYSIPQNSFVTLKVYDVIGKEVATLVNQSQSAGKYEVRFDASNLSNGVYMYSIKTDNFTSTKKMILIK